MTSGFRSKAERHLSFLWPVLLAFLIGWLVIALTAQRQHVNLFAGTTWGFSDVNQYLTVSQSGYVLHPCEWDATLSCGDAGWQPLYPLLIRGLSATGIQPLVAGFILSSLFFMGALFILWQFIQKYSKRPRYENVGLLSLAAVFPGMIYFYDVFPLSLVLFLLLLLFWALPRKHYPAIVLSSLLLPLAYSSAIIFTLAIFLWLVLCNLKKKQHWLPAAASIIAGIAGELLFFVILKISTGNWKAQLLVQQKYGNGIHNPIDTLAVQLKSLPDVGYFKVLNLVAVETTLVLVLMVLLTAVVYEKRRQLTDTDKLIFISVCVFWVVPLIVGAGISSYRSHALLMPAVLLLRYLPRKVLLILGLCMLPVAYLLIAGVLNHQFI